MTSVDRSGLRVPPSAIDAEQSVLGGLMLRPDALQAIATQLSEEDFYRHDHRMIYRAMLELTARGTPCDAMTMADWFERNDLSQYIPVSYFLQLANETPSAANIEAYAAIVRERAVRRQVIEVATNLVERAYGHEHEATELVDGGISDLMGMQRVQSATEYTLRQAISMAYDDAEQAKARGGKIPGIHTGLTKLDEVLGGWHNSDLIIIGARPSMGKTALILNMALGSNVAGGLISTEQPARQIGSRILSIDGGINASHLRNGTHDEQDLERMVLSVTRLMDRELLISDRSSPTIADVKRLARMWKQKHDIKMLMADYVQRIKGTDQRAKKHEQVAEVSAGLKDIARELDIPVVALAQVSREVEKRTDKRPGMGDLSDSSELEKEADQILMVYRDEVYNPDSPDKGTAEICIEKNRHGPTGFVRAAWIPETMRFRDLSPEDFYGR